MKKWVATLLKVQKEKQNKEKMNRIKKSGKKVKKAQNEKRKIEEKQKEGEKIVILIKKDYWHHSIRFFFYSII